MFKEDTARKMGIKFFKEQGYPKIATWLVEGYCADSVFGMAVRSLGKSKTLALYIKLPKQLRIYLRMFLEGGNDQRLEKNLQKLYDEFCLVLDSHRPERMKRFLPELAEDFREVVEEVLKEMLATAEKEGGGTMSDYDKTKQLFVDLGLNPKLIGRPDERRITLDDGCDKMDAYAGFFAMFSFGKDGDFLEVSIGE